MKKGENANWHGPKQLLIMIISALLFFISSCMVANTTNTVLPFFAAERGWNVSVLMMMAGIAMLISVVFAIFFGRLSTRIGAKKIIIIMLFLAACSTLLYGFTKDMRLFILAIIMNAVFASGYQNVGVSVLINTWFPRKKGIVLGWVTMGIIASDIIWVPLIPKALAAVGTEKTMVIVACAFLVLMVVVACIVKDTPEEMGTYPDGDATGIEDLEANIKAFREYQSPYTIGKMFCTPRTWQIIFGWGLLWLVSIAYISQEVLRFISIGYDAGFAASVMGIAGFGGLFGSWLFGFLDTKFGTKRSTEIFTIWILVMFVLALFHSLGIAMIWVTAFGVACAIGGVCNLIPSMVGTCFGRWDFAAANAVINPLTLAFCAMGVFMGGFFANGIGYQKMYMVCIVLIIIAAVIVFTTKDDLIGKED